MSRISSREPGKKHPTALAAVLLLITTTACATPGTQPGPEPETLAGVPRQWSGVPEVVLDQDSYLLHSADVPDVRVRVLTRGLTHPWALAFLPSGDMLVTEREGRLRVIRPDGTLDPEPVANVPEVFVDGAFSGFMEVVLHPDFERNRLVYLTYIRPDGDAAAAEAADSDAPPRTRLVLARARFEDHALHDLEEIFLPEPADMRISGSRIQFAADGNLFLSVGGAFDYRGSAFRSQDPTLHAGKILRLRDDGSPAPDNPFVGETGWAPEIWSLGHRNPMGFGFHPETGDLWAVEHAPQGGDEVNIIRPGANYGWPVVSHARRYTGSRISDLPWKEGMAQPEVLWIPSIAPSGMAFYTGDAFPAWQGDLFVGSLMEGRIRRTGHLERVVFNARGEEVAREGILRELQQRIREVRQGPDGLLYLLTEEEDGALLRLEPVG